MIKYVRVMDGLKSNASGEEFKLDEVIIAKIWNPKEIEPEKMGGFNFSTEDKILRYIFRGYINASKYIIDDIVNKDNIDEAIKEFEEFAGRTNGNTTGIFNYNKLFPEAKKIYNLLLNIRDK